MLALGILAGLASAGSALFTDTATIDANTFTTGSVGISTNPTTAAVTFSNMVPGDQVTAPIDVNNTGTLELRYAVTSVATNSDSLGLMSQLDLTIKTGVTTCSNAGFGVDGTVIYGPNDLGSLAGINVIGDPAQGNDSGDRVLAASASEVLCFNVTLPLSTPDTYQGAATTATFTFAAEQTVNN
jgi:hypothetical protein